MRDSPDFYDVTLVWKEEQQFEAHRVLLENRNTFYITTFYIKTPVLSFIWQVKIYLRFWELKLIDVHGKLLMVKFKWYVIGLLDGNLLCANPNLER